MLDRQRFEVPNELLKGLKLGDEVTVSIKGTVTELVAGKDPKTKEDVKKSKGDDCCGCNPLPWEPPAALHIKASSTTIKAGSNEFSKLSEDDE